MPAAPAAFARWRRGRGPAPAWWTIPVGVALIAAVWAGWTALLLGGAMLVTMAGGADPLSAIARLQIALVPGAPGTLAFAPPPPKIAIAAGPCESPRGAPIGLETRRAPR